MTTKEYKQLGCEDFGGGDCYFLIRAETEDEILKIFSGHCCTAHGKCQISPETESKIKSRIQTIAV